MHVDELVVLYVDTGMSEQVATEIRLIADEPRRGKLAIPTRQAIRNVGTVHVPSMADYNTAAVTLKRQVIRAVRDSEAVMGGPRLPRPALEHLAGVVFEKLVDPEVHAALGMFMRTEASV